MVEIYAPIDGWNLDDHLLIFLYKSLLLVPVSDPSFPDVLSDGGKMKLVSDISHEKQVSDFAAPVFAL